MFKGQKLEETKRQKKCWFTLSALCIGGTIVKSWDSRDCTKPKIIYRILVRIKDRKLKESPGVNTP